MPLKRRRPALESPSQPLASSSSSRANGTVSTTPSKRSAPLQGDSASPSVVQRLFSRVVNSLTPLRKRPRLEPAALHSSPGPSSSILTSTADLGEEAPASGFIDITPSPSKSTSALVSTSPIDRHPPPLVFTQEGAIRDPLGRTTLASHPVPISDTRSSSEDAAEMQMQTSSTLSTPAFPAHPISSRTDDARIAHQHSATEHASQDSSSSDTPSSLDILAPSSGTPTSSHQVREDVQDEDASGNQGPDTASSELNANPHVTLGEPTEAESMSASDAQSPSLHSTSSLADPTLPTDADVDHIESASTAKVGENVEGLLQWSAPLTTDEVAPPSPPASDHADADSSQVESAKNAEPQPTAAVQVVDLTTDSDDSASDTDDPDKENDGSLVQPSPLLDSHAVLAPSDHRAPSSESAVRAPRPGSMFGPLSNTLRKERKPVQDSSRFPFATYGLVDSPADVSATEQVVRIGRQTSFVQPSRNRLPQSSTPRQSLPAPAHCRSTSFGSPPSSVASDMTAPRKRSSSGFTKRGHIYQKQFFRTVEAFNESATRHSIREAINKINIIRASNRKPQLSQEQILGLAAKSREVKRIIDAENNLHGPSEDVFEALTRRLLRQKQKDAQTAILPVPAAKLLERERLARETRARERRLRGVLGRKALPERLTDEQDKAAHLALTKPGKIAAIPGAEVEARDVQKLRPGQWLNDEVINFYGNLILQRANEADKKRTEAMQKAKSDATPAPAPADKAAKGKTAGRGGKPRETRPYPEALDAFWRVHFFSSFFWENLKNRGFDGVKRWTRRVDVFSKDIVLFPINLGNSHWVCGAINLRCRRFEYYDSLGARNPRAFELMRIYLVEEAKDKKKQQLDLRGWRDVFSDESPQQENGYDCGVFAAQTLEQISRRDPHSPIPLDPPSISWKSDSLEGDAGKMNIGNDEDEDEDEYEWNFGQENMPYLRRRMAYEIMSQQLLD